jgi:hypothetical protein
MPTRISRPTALTIDPLPGGCHEEHLALVVDPQSWLRELREVLVAHAGDGDDRESRYEQGRLKGPTRRETRLGHRDGKQPHA